MSSIDDSPVAGAPPVREGSLSKSAFLKKPPAKPPPAKASGVRTLQGKPVLPMSPAKSLGGSATSAKTEGGLIPVSVSFLKRAPVGPGPLPKRASADASEAPPVSSTPREEEETEAVEDSESPVHNEEQVAEEVEEAPSELHANYEEEVGSEAAHEASSIVDEGDENVHEESEMLTPHETADVSLPDQNQSRMQSDMNESEQADPHEAQDREIEEGADEGPLLSPAEGETEGPPPPGHQETFDASTTYSADTLHSATISKSAKVKLLDSIEPQGGGGPLPGCRCCCCKQQQKLRSGSVAYVPGGPPFLQTSSFSYPSKTRTSVYAAPQMHAPAASFAWAPYAYPLPPVQSAHFAPTAPPVSSSNSGMDVEMQLNVTSGPQDIEDADDLSSESDLGPVYRTVYTRPKNYKMGNTYCKHYQLPTVASLLRAGMPEFLRKRPIKIMTEGSGRSVQLDGAFKFEVELKTENDACNACTNPPCCQSFHPQLQACCSTETVGPDPTATSPVGSQHECSHSPMHAHTPASPASAVEGAPDASPGHMMGAPDGYGGSSGGGPPFVAYQGYPQQPLQQMGPPSYGGYCWQVPVHPGVCTPQVDATGSSLWPPPSSHARFSVDHSGRTEAEARDQWSHHHHRHHHDYLNPCQMPQPSFSQGQGAAGPSGPLCSRGAPGFFLSRAEIERDVHVIGAQGNINDNNNNKMQGTFKGGLKLAVSPPSKKLW
ncbi:hypothetical protein Emed_003157 [Eimeria media]